MSKENRDKIVLEKTKLMFDENGDCTHIYRCKEKHTQNILCTICSELLIEGEKPLTLEYLLEWHEPHEEYETFCPSCASDYIKCNGNGFFRCKGHCKNRWYILRCNEDD